MYYFHYFYNGYIFRACIKNKSLYKRTSPEKSAIFTNALYNGHSRIISCYSFTVKQKAAPRLGSGL